MSEFVFKKKTQKKIIPSKEFVFVGDQTHVHMDIDDCRKKYYVLCSVCGKILSGKPNWKLRCSCNRVTIIKPYLVGENK